MCFLRRSINWDLRVTNIIQIQSNLESRISSEAITRCKMNAGRKKFQQQQDCNCELHCAFRQCLIITHDMIQFPRSDKQINTILTCRSKVYPVLQGSRVARPSKDYPLGNKIKPRPWQSCKHENRF